MSIVYLPRRVQSGPGLQLPHTLGWDGFDKWHALEVPLLILHKVRLIVYLLIGLHHTHM